MSEASNVQVSPLSKSRTRYVAFFLLVQTLIFAPMILSSFYGCAHTVEQQVIHDTDTILQMDTTFRVPQGSAFIRLTAFIDGGGPILLRTRVKGQEFLFSNALSQTVKDFIPVRNDTPFTLYAEYYNGATKLEDSISVPADSLFQFSLTSIALFQVTDGFGQSRLYPYFANDSMKNVPLGESMAYLRITNGLSDYPQPTPSVNVYVDDPNGTPIFTMPATYQEIRNYVVIPSGQHTIYVKSSTDGQQLYSIQKNFVGGMYYSGRLTGKKELSSDQFSIDTE